MNAQFKEKYFYWGTIILLKKMIIVVLLVAIPSKLVRDCQQLLVFCFVFVLFLFYVLQIKIELTQKYMSLEIDATCMYSDFGGRGICGFGDEISLWSIVMEKFNRSESAKKIMQVGIDVMCMHTSFGGRGLFIWRYGCLLKTTKFPFRPMDYSPWSSKNLINRNQLKKFMQVGIDV